MQITLSARSDMMQSNLTEVILNIGGGYVYDYCTIYWRSNKIQDYSEDFVYGRFSRNYFTGDIKVFIDDDVTELLIVPVLLRNSTFEIRSINVEKYKV